ncbi:pyridoxal phosphate-dependent aminotransferase [Shimia sp.]|uniref:pyridoxal phosphate-dependent aminotransferase n=1 Tax=Shimia sp. TaxID=1954381 RepID=UPI003BA96D9D
MKGFSDLVTRLAALEGDQWELQLRARRMNEAGGNIIELTIGEPDVPTPHELVDACFRAIAEGRTRYSPAEGELTLRQTLAEKYSARTGRTISPDSFICYPGTQTALYAAMQLFVQAGDDVLLSDPYYATYEAVIRSTGADMVPVALHQDKGFRLQPEDLEAAITPRSKVLLLNNPHNPTGVNLNADELRAIAEVCVKHDLWIIADEVYEALIFDQSFASLFDMQEFAERVVVVSSISKSHAAPGFRSGWMAASEEVCNAAIPPAVAMLFGNQPFIADMTVWALTHELPVTAEMRNAYGRRAEMANAILADSALLTPLPPQAGMFLCVDVSATGLSGSEFANRLLDDQEVAVMPGSSFGAQAAHLIRLSLTVPDEHIKTACERICRFAADLTEMAD